MKKIILMRHSIPEKLDLPTALLPLSEDGRALAKTKVKKFASIDKCYSSPYKRAFETAKILSPKPISVIEDLHERLVGEAHEDFWLKQYQDQCLGEVGGKRLDNM